MKIINTTDSQKVSDILAEKIGKNLAEGKRVLWLCVM